MEREQQILSRISEMVAAEQRLRESLRAGVTDMTEEHQRLGALERELDRRWDLLRQRRAKAEFGQGPDEARVRPVSQVEGYAS
ncbi:MULTISPECIES: DUF2630 family protein [Streptomyces]|uniref:DUF2630 family protein n=2 Tax=Streptomyces TaxID=1883 RepID=A0ABT9LAQ0_STRGD|nr:MULTISPECIES: DUF2630 family protein [Streptomyces]MDP9680330.1 hypothetical protein [Streptomyces griseoviridis]GHI29152.1 hypothetical protein Sdagh_08820 [Streptomyces daghestanicus]